MRHGTFGPITPRRFQALELPHPMPDGEQEACRSAFDALAAVAGLDPETDEWQEHYTMARAIWWQCYLHGARVHGTQVREAMGR